MGRISGPLLDRIDLHIEVPPVPFEDLSKPADGTGSATMREQVDKARAIQAKRFGKGAGKLNGRMTSRQIRTHCKLDAAGHASLKDAMDALGLSARAHDRILRVARTVADLAGSESITARPRRRSHRLPGARPQAVGAVNVILLRRLRCA